MLDFLYDLGMHVFERSLLLNLPPSKDMLFIRVSVAGYLFVESHKLDGLFHLC